MPKSVIVLKPFVFSYPPKNAKQKLATELKITPDKDPATKEWIPTERDLPDDVARHEWIEKQFADGAIERPEKTKERMAKIAAEQEKQREANAKVLRDAQAALDRASKKTDIQNGREAQVDADLNTPVNELRANRGADIDKVDTSDPAVQKELNTPVNQLPKAGDEVVGNEAQ